MSLPSSSTSRSQNGRARGVGSRGDGKSAPEVRFFCVSVMFFYMFLGFYRGGRTLCGAEVKGNVDLSRLWLMIQKGEVV